MGGQASSVGYVGLGNLGVHLAASLVRAGHKVTVTDLHRESAAGLIDAGAFWADSAQEVAVVSDVVFTCLPSPAAVDAVVTGPAGVLAGLRAGGTWIDNSTNDRAETLRLAEIAAGTGVRTLEAPVTGGVHKAAAGEITVLVGGEEALFDEHRDLLGAIGLCCTWGRSAVPP